MSTAANWSIAELPDEFDRNRLASVYEKFEQDREGAVWPVPRFVPSARVSSGQPMVVCYDIVEKEQPGKLLMWAMEVPA